MIEASEIQVGAALSADRTRPARVTFYITKAR
jgi:hypothetical protein